MDQLTPQEAPSSPRALLRAAGGVLENTIALIMHSSEVQYTVVRHCITGIELSVVQMEKIRQKPPI